MLPVYKVICEGVSECNYLLHLQRVLNALPFPEGCFAPLRLIASPKRLDPKTLKSIGVGSGVYGNVISDYQSEFKNNKTLPFIVWVDDDIYVRNDHDCQVNYNAKPSGIPDFSFSVHNFEDFLALHHPDDKFEEWKREFACTTHFNHPLHSVDYMPHYLKVFPDYRKGELPDGFITAETLKNMIRRGRELPLMTSGSLNSTRTFVADLSRILCTVYPDVFR